MKLLKNLAGAIIFILIAVSSACSVKAQRSEKNIKKALQAAEVKDMVNSQNFVFVPGNSFAVLTQRQQIPPK